MLELILSELEKHVGIVPVKGTNEMKEYHLLPIGESFEVWVKPLNPGMFFRSTIAPMITPTDREGFYSFLMKANFLGQGTGGSVVALDPDEKFLTLCKEISYEVNYKLFRDALEDFVNYLEYWREEIRKYEAKTTS